ncbi:hypothetical protein [Streptomyces sp. NPDC026589]|uniref:hypothetical protein n=1 Tax=Streptomyces sp. NPDC026589 TaxID=3155609 RepID=UPI0033D427EA
MDSSTPPFVPVIPLIEMTLAAAAQEGIGELHQVEQRIAHAVASWAFRSHRREPPIIPSSLASDTPSR